MKQNAQGVTIPPPARVQTLSGRNTFEPSSFHFQNVPTKRYIHGRRQLHQGGEHNSTPPRGF